MLNVVNCVWGPWDLKPYDYPGTRDDNSMETECYGLYCPGNGLTPLNATGNRTRKLETPAEHGEQCEGNTEEECSAPCPGT